MAEWVERTSFPKELGRHFENRGQSDFSFVTFHSDGHVMVNLGNRAAVELAERIQAAGYTGLAHEIGEGGDVRGFRWERSEPAPDPAALVFG
jgi:hypothetical protein